MIFCTIVCVIGAVLAYFLLKGAKTDSDAELAGL